MALSEKANRVLSEVNESSALGEIKKVAKNCTPSYLPAFIRTEIDKLSRRQG